MKVLKWYVLRVFPGSAAALSALVRGWPLHLEQSASLHLVGALRLVDYVWSRMFLRPRDTGIVPPDVELVAGH